MNERPDMELLREYSDRGADKAFEIVVSRHVGMVYHAALRQTGQPEMAKDIAQTVFTLLARKSARLSPQTVVAGWLVKTTRFVASHMVREDSRRRRRNEEASQMNSDPVRSNDGMDGMLRLLDAALAQLRTADRDALSLRYLDGKTFAEVALAIGATEDAARKRVQRALERLRGLLDRRGVVVGTSALATGLGAFSAQAAPEGLAMAISSAAVQQASGMAAVSLLTHTTIQVMKFIQWKTTAIAVGAMALVGAAGVVFTHPTQVSAPSMGEASDSALEQKVKQLEVENRRLNGSLADAENARLGSDRRRREAEERISAYQQLAAKLHAENLSPEEEYPTRRHIWVGMGRNLAVMLESNALLANGDKMPESERKMRQADLIKRAQEMYRVAEAGSKIDPGETPSKPEEYADVIGCTLYGALNLDEQQFSQVSGLLLAYYQGKGGSVKSEDIMSANSVPGSLVAGKTWGDLDEQTSRAIETFLNPSQQETFHAILSTPPPADARRLMETSTPDPGAAKVP